MKYRLKGSYLVGVQFVPLHQLNGVKSTNGQPVSLLIPYWTSSGTMDDYGKSNPGFRPWSTLKHRRSRVGIHPPRRFSFLGINGCYCQN